MSAVEVNFDGLVGPTHHYGGLGQGNLASIGNAGERSNPKAAALEGLAKMRTMLSLGLVQGVIPPQERPNVGALRRLGYSGSDQALVSQVARENLGLLSAVSSASSMWTANAATVSPSADTHDGRVHFTPANLSSHLHRSIETTETGQTLERIFSDSDKFTHHRALPSSSQTGDEGAANHSRLTTTHGSPGVELFVYGTEPLQLHSGRFPARQSLLASRAVAGLHGLTASNTVMARQSKQALDGGVFHNDVIAVADRDVLLYHESTFADEANVLAELRSKMGGPLRAVRVSSTQLPLGDAVSSYLFNSQLVQTPNGRVLIAPTDAEENTSAAGTIEALTGEAFDRVVFLNLRQSMRNGGGPACLRLRVVLTDAELASVHQRCLVTDALLDELEAWVTAHYRDSLSSTDLADPAFLDEVRTALDSLTEILALPRLYTFQQ